MVTPAFAQAGSIIVLRNPGGLTGGEEGLALNRDALLELLPTGVANAPYRYWLAPAARARVLRRREGPTRGVAGPLSEPTFVLGALFIAVVFFAPGGLVGLVRRRRSGPAMVGEGA